MDDDKNNCVICFEEMENNTITFSCKHSLHSQCFASYTQHKLTQGQTSIACPLCLKEIMQIHPVNGVVHHSPSIVTPIRRRSRCQFICQAFINVTLTLGASGLIFYVVDRSSNS